MAYVKGPDQQPAGQPLRWHIRLENDFEEEAARQFNYFGEESEDRQRLEDICQMIQFRADRLRRGLPLPGTTGSDEYLEALMSTYVGYMVSASFLGFVSWQLERWGLPFRRKASYRTHFLAAGFAMGVRNAIDPPVDFDEVTDRSTKSIHAGLYLLGLGFTAFQLKEAVFKFRRRSSK